MTRSRGRIIAAVLCMVMSIGLLAGCKPATPGPGPGVDDKYGGFITFRRAVDLQRPNFLLTRDGPGGDMRALTQDSLFAKDAAANLVPRVATGYQVSDDGLVYTVSLRNDVKWQDGVPFTADDVLFYYEYTEKITSVDKPDAPDYTVAKVDDHTVKFTLEKANAFFPWDLSYVMLPKHIWSNVDPASWDEVSDLSMFVGLGPFKLVERKVGEYVKMERFDDYWDGKPYLDGVIYQVIGDNDAANVAFESGQVNFMVVGYDVYENLKDDSSFKFQSYPSGNMRVVLVNQKDPRLSDLAVRAALSHCMDRQTMIIMNQAKAQPMASCFTPADTYSNAAAADAAAFEYNIAKASQVLEDAGWKLGADGIREKDGQKLDLTMLTWISNNPSGVVIIDSCKQAGIKVTMKTIDTALFVEKVFADDPDYELAYNGMTMGPDPGGYAGMYSKGTYTTYVNEALQPKFDALAAETDVVKAQKLADEIQAEVTKDRAALWLYSAETIWGTDSKLNLDGCGMSGLYPSWIDLSKAYFEK